MPDINSLTLHIGEKLVIFSEGGDLVMVRGADNLSVLSVVAGGGTPPPEMQPVSAPADAATKEE